MSSVGKPSGCWHQIKACELNVIKKVLTIAFIQKIISVHYLKPIKCTQVFHRNRLKARDDKIDRALCVIDHVQRRTN